MTPVRCRIHLLQTGACAHPEIASIKGGRLAPAAFPALSALILHPTEGALLWDTGYDPAFFHATRRWPERLYALATPVSFAHDDAVARQIVRFGLTPGDVRGVIVSHFHGDHVAGLAAFPDARIYCARAGLTQVRAVSRFAGVRQGILPQLVPPDAETRAVFFEDRPRRDLSSDLLPFRSGADVLGDGSLLAVELPGHCVGHWGLAVRGEDDRWRLFVGDAAWSRRAIRENRPPPRLTTDLLGRTAPYRRTLADLHALHARGTDTVLAPSHCPETAAEAEPR